MRRGAGHPKMAALVAALLRHFGGSNDGPESGAEGDNGGGTVYGGDDPDMGRAIVFTNLRESVAAIVETLAPHAPRIKPRCPPASELQAHTIPGDVPSSHSHD